MAQALGEGQRQADREFANPMYLKTGDPGMAVGGTATGTNTEPTLEMYENIFGPAGRDVKIDSQRHKRHQRWHLPDNLKGHNQYLTDRIDGLITDATNSPFTRNILPYVYLENPHQKLKWNVYSFDEGIASRVPYEAAARVLPQTKRSFAGYTVRQGLAIAMEHNFMVSAAGQQNFKNQLTQLVGSIQMTNDLDVHVALLQAPSYQKHLNEKYHDSTKTTQQLCREYVDMFGFLQKTPNALDILIEDAKNHLRTWGSPPPTFMLCNGSLTAQLTMLPEKTNYITNGPDGLKRLANGPELPSYRGLSIIHSRKFSMEAGSMPRDLLRRRVRVAEYYHIPWSPDAENREYEFYDQSRDTMFRLSWDQMLKMADMSQVPANEDMDVDGGGWKGGSGGGGDGGGGGGFWIVQPRSSKTFIRLNGENSAFTMGGKLLASKVLEAVSQNRVIDLTGGPGAAQVTKKAITEQVMKAVGALQLPGLIRKTRWPYEPKVKTLNSLELQKSSKMEPEVWNNTCFSTETLMNSTLIDESEQNKLKHHEMSETFGMGLFNDHITKNARLRNFAMLKPSSVSSHYVFEHIKLALNYVYQERGNEIARTSSTFKKLMNRQKVDLNEGMFLFDSKQYLPYLFYMTRQRNNFFGANMSFEECKQNLSTLKGDCMLRTREQLNALKDEFDAQDVDWINTRYGVFCQYDTMPFCKKANHPNAANVVIDFTNDIGAGTTLWEHCWHTLQVNTNDMDPVQYNAISNQAAGQVDDFIKFVGGICSTQIHLILRKWKAAVAYELMVHAMCGGTLENFTSKQNIDCYDDIIHDLISTCMCDIVTSDNPTMKQNIQTFIADVSDMNKSTVAEGLQVTAVAGAYNALEPSAINVFAALTSCDFETDDSRCMMPALCMPNMHLSTCQPLRTSDMERSATSLNPAAWILQGAMSSVICSKACCDHLLKVYSTWNLQIPEDELDFNRTQTEAYQLQQDILQYSMFWGISIKGARSKQLKLWDSWLMHATMSYFHPNKAVRERATARAGITPESRHALCDYFRRVIRDNNLKSSEKGLTDVVEQLVPDNYNLNKSVTSILGTASTEMRYMSAVLNVIQPSNFAKKHNVRDIPVSNTENYQVLQTTENSEYRGGRNTFLREMSKLLEVPLLLPDSASWKHVSEFYYDINDCKDKSAGLKKLDNLTGEAQSACLVRPWLSLCPDSMGCNRRLVSVDNEYSAEASANSVSTVFDNEDSLLQQYSSDAQELCNSQPDTVMKHFLLIMCQRMLGDTTRFMHNGEGQLLDTGVGVQSRRLPDFAVALTYTPRSQNTFHDIVLRSTCGGLSRSGVIDKCTYYNYRQRDSIKPQLHPPHYVVSGKHIMHGPDLPDVDDSSMDGIGQKDIFILRPNIEHEMLGIIMGRGGTQELGATFWGQTELSCYDDAQHGIWGMSYKYHERAMVTNERNLIRVFDVAFDGYNGGMDQTYVNWNSNEDLYAFRQATYARNLPYTGQSMLVMALPHNPECTRSNLPNPVVFHSQVAGRVSVDPQHDYMLPRVDDMQIFRPNSAHMTPEQILAYNAYMERLGMSAWSSVDQSSRPAGENCVQNESTSSLLAFQGTMRVCDKHGGCLEHVQGSGHLGPSYVGVASVREGRGLQAAPGMPQLVRQI